MRAGGGWKIFQKLTGGRTIIRYSRVGVTTCPELGISCNAPMLTFICNLPKNLKVPYLSNNICSMANGQITAHVGIKTGLRFGDKEKMSFFSEKCYN